MEISKGAIYLGLSAAVISGFSNFLNKLAVSAVADPVFFTFLKNGLVVVLLLAAVILGKEWWQVRNLNKNDWLRLVAIGVIGGGLPFILFFTGLTLTSAVNASLIHKTLFIWVALLAAPFLGERLGKIQWAALGLLLFGNFFLGSWQQLTFGRGELMILAATLFWAIENIIAKKTLQNISATTVAAARMAIGSLLLLVVVAWQGNLDLISTLTIKQWAWTLATSTLLFGYVVCWYTALAKAPASVVASLLVPAALITGLLSLIFQDKALTSREIWSGAVVVLAIWLIVWSGRRVKPAPNYAAVSRHQN